MRFREMGWLLMVSAESGSDCIEFFAKLVGLNVVMTRCLTATGFRRSADSETRRRADRARLCERGIARRRRSLRAVIFNGARMASESTKVHAYLLYHKHQIMITAQKTRGI
jgi:hypothetical protein